MLDMSKIVFRLRKSKTVEVLGLAGTIIGGMAAIAGLCGAGYGLYLTYYADPVHTSTVCLREYRAECFEQNIAFEKRLSDTMFDRAHFLKIRADITEAPFLDDRACVWPFEDDSPYRFELPLDADCNRRAFMEFEPTFWNDLSRVQYGGGTIRSLNGKFEVGAVSDFIWAEGQPGLSAAYLYQLKFIERID